jgi:hypothetical protein
MDEEWQPKLFLQVYKNEKQDKFYCSWKIFVIWDVMSYSLVEIYGRYGGTSENFYQAVQCHNADVGPLLSHCHEDLKSFSFLLSS